MRWLNTGYSISFRCRTAVVLDNAGILFFTTGANADCALIVFIFYHIVGMWKSLLACQPSCPTWLCHLLMCNCRQTVRSLGDQWGSLHTDCPSRCWHPAELVAELGPSLFPEPLGHIVLMIPTGTWQRYEWLPVFVFSPPWKSRFYSNAFKTSGLCADPVTVGC